MHTFEIHATAAVLTAADPPLAGAPWDIDELFENDAAAHEANVLSIGEADGWFGVGVDAANGRLCRVFNRAAALAEFKVVPRRVNACLVMLPHSRDILVNSEPVADMQVLAVKDSLILSPGGPLGYVTERFVPYCGPPTADMLARKLKCPGCRLSFAKNTDDPDEKETQVLTCKCGSVVHAETATSHPRLAEGGRLDCGLKKLANCLSCGRPLTLEPSLVWDPIELRAAEEN